MSPGDEQYWTAVQTSAGDSKTLLPGSSNPAPGPVSGGDPRRRKPAPRPPLPTANSLLPTAHPASAGSDQDQEDTQ